MYICPIGKKSNAIVVHGSEYMDTRDYKPCRACIIIFNMFNFMIDLIVYLVVLIISAYMAVLTAAIQYEKDMEWAMKRVRELGFNVGPTKKKDVYYMFQYWLDNDNYNSSDANIKEEL